MVKSPCQRVPSTIRWVNRIYDRVTHLSNDLGLSKNDVFNLLVREALDARDEYDARSTTNLEKRKSRNV